MNEIKILVVEDEIIVREYIKTSLQKLGYAVCAEVSYGEEVIPAIEETAPDLVLLDIKLKGSMDGIKAGEEIYQNYKIPVIYLTAYADKTTLQRAKKTRPFGYLVKPFEENELYSTVEIVLEKHREEKEQQKKMIEELQYTQRKISSLLNKLTANTDSVAGHSNVKQFTLKQAARYLGINEKTVRRMVKEDNFPEPSSMVDIGNDRKARCWTKEDLDQAKMHLRRKGRPRKSV